MEKVKIVCLVVVLVSASLCFAWDYPAELNGFLGTGASMDWSTPTEWSYGHVPTADEDVATFLCSPAEPWQLHVTTAAVGANLFMQGTNGDAGDHIYIFDGGSLTIGGNYVMGPMATGAPNWGSSIPKHIPEVYINAGGSLSASSYQIAGDQGRELRMWVNGSLDVGEIRVFDMDNGTTTNYLSMMLQDGIADIGLGTINEAGTGSAGGLVSIDIMGGTLLAADAGFAADVAAGVILANGVTVTQANMDSLLTVSSAGGITTASLIPEPATISLLALGGLGLIRRRRSR